jgi:hypothetical protein
MKERDTPHPVILRKETMTNIARRTAQKVMMTMTTTTIMVEVARDTTKTRAKDSLGIERALVPRGVTNANDTLFISPVLILCRTK